MKVYTKVCQFFQDIALIAKYQPRTLAAVWTAARGYLLLSMGVTVIEATAPFGQIWVGKLIIDKVVAAISVASSGGKPEIQGFFVLLALQFSLWMLREVCGALSGPTRALLAERVNHQIEKLVMEKAASVQLLWYERPEFQDQLANAKRAIVKCTSSLHDVLNFSQQIVSLVAAAGILSRLHWLAPGVLCVFLVPQMVLRMWFGRAQWRLENTQTPTRRMISYLCNILILRTDAKEVRIFGLKHFLLKRCHQLWERIFQQNRKFFISHQVVAILAGIIATLGAIAVYTYTVYQAAYRRITLGDLMLYLQVTGQVQMHFLQMLFQFSSVYETGLEQMHFYQFLDLDAPSTATGESGKPVATRRFPAQLSKGIECKHVWFQYPGSEHWALEDVTFTIHPGEKVAFVGENGAGKTTLAKLIIGLYDVAHGVVCINGYDVCSYERQELYRHLGIIFQDFSHYELTARENIGFGNVARLLDMEQIVAAAEKGGARTIIENLPNGYETYLGRWFEQGMDLSGGEWQKIALSRAFMRDAQILILDEPTASLDTQSEAQIYQRIDELTKGKIVIFISHRFSTVKMADRIFFLQKGRIIESGSHTELMQHRGFYAEMYQLQADRYAL